MDNEKRITQLSHEAQLTMQANCGTFSLHDYIYDGCLLCLSDDFLTEKAFSFIQTYLIKMVSYWNE